MERRRGSDYVTHAEFRAVLEPILARHREIDEALALYRRMVPLGVAELLPEILADARVRKVLSEAAEGRWKTYRRWAAVVGSLYVAITLVGGSMAILRTLGILH